MTNTSVYDRTKLTRKYLWESGTTINRAFLPGFADYFAMFEAGMFGIPEPDETLRGHEPAYTRMVIEMASKIEQPLDARAFAKHFVDKPTLYSTSKVGRSALRMEAWIRESGGLIATRLVELVIKEKDSTYLIILEGKIPEADFLRFTEAVQEFAKLDKLVSAGDINTERGTVSDVTIYEVTPKAVSKKRAGSSKAFGDGDMTPPNNPVPTGFDKYPGSDDTDDDLKQLESVDEASDNYQDNLSEAIRKPQGECYQWAAEWLCIPEFSELGRELTSEEGKLPKSAKLAHGYPTLQRPPYKKYGHAWIEVTVGGEYMVYDPTHKPVLKWPKAVYYSVGNIESAEVSLYTENEARKYLCDKKHYGPWKSGTPDALFKDPKTGESLGQKPRNFTDWEADDFDLDDSIEERVGGSVEGPSRWERDDETNSLRSNFGSWLVVESPVSSGGDSRVETVAVFRDAAWSADVSIDEVHELVNAVFGHYADDAEADLTAECILREVFSEGAHPVTNFADFQPSFVSDRLDEREQVVQRNSKMRQVVETGLALKFPSYRISNRHMAEGMQKRGFAYVLLPSFPVFHRSDSSVLEFARTKAKARSMVRDLRETHSMVYEAVPIGTFLRRGPQAYGLDEAEDPATTDRTSDPEFYRDDLQDYYDALLVMGHESKEALERVRSKFKLKSVEVTVMGEVRAKGVVDNPKPALAAPAGMGGGGEAPPEEAPAEESFDEARVRKTGHVGFKGLVQVFRNLHQGTDTEAVWSVVDAKTGLVIGHAVELVLRDVIFTTGSGAAAARVRKDKQKNVHAKVIGYIVDKPPTLSGQAVTYNPYKYSKFATLPNENVILSAREVSFGPDGKRIYAKGAEIDRDASALLTSDEKSVVMAEAQKVLCETPVAPGGGPTLFGGGDTAGGVAIPGIGRGGGVVTGIRPVFGDTRSPGSPEGTYYKQDLDRGDEEAQRREEAYRASEDRLTTPLDPSQDPADAAEEMVAEFGRLLGLEESDMDEGLRNLLTRGKKLLGWMKSAVEKMKKGLSVEKVETLSMVKTFVQVLKRKFSHRPGSVENPSEKEVRAALRQMKDVAKVAAVATVMLGPIPGDEPILVVLELLAQMVGMTLFPSAMQGIISLKAMRGESEDDSRSFEEYMFEEFALMWANDGTLFEGSQDRELTQEQKTLHSRWKRLVNMTSESLRMFFRDKQLQEVLKNSRKSKTEGIRLGVAEGRRLLSMKNRPVTEWNEGMWRAAQRQVQFIERTRRNPAALFDDMQRPTRKVYTLRAWGHDPVVRESINESSFIYQQRKGELYICPHCQKDIQENELKFKCGMWEHSCGGAVGLTKTAPNAADANRWLDSTPGNAPYYIGSLHEQTAPTYAVLRAYKDGLTEEEITTIQESDCAVPVWKATGTTGDWYVANTHRAYVATHSLSDTLIRVDSYLKHTV